MPSVNYAGGRGKEVSGFGVSGFGVSGSRWKSTEFPDYEVDFITYYDTLLEYYLHVDPSKLDDGAWIRKIKALAMIRDEESIRN